MLTLAVRPSRLLAAMLGAMHGAAGFGMLVLPIPWWLRLAALTVLGWSLFHSIARHALQWSPDAIIGLKVGVECRCELAREDKQWFEAELQPGSFVTPYLTILNFRRPGDGKGLSLVLMPDAVDADDFRRLRVLLKWECPRCWDKEIRPTDSLGR